MGPNTTGGVAGDPELTVASPPAHAALNSIRRLVRALRVSASDAERHTGLSGAQTFVLQLLAQRPAESMNELAARTLTDQSSVSVVVSRLEEKQLVERSASPADARRTVVRITPKGRKLLAGRPETAQVRLIRALEMMPPDALVSLARELGQVITFMGASHERPSLFFEDDPPKSH